VLLSSVVGQLDRLGMRLKLWLYLFALVPGLHTAVDSFQLMSRRSCLPRILNIREVSPTTSMACTSGGSENASFSSHEGEEEEDLEENDEGNLPEETKRELLFQEVLNSYLQTLAVATNCCRALVYLQSEKEKVLQVVCRYPQDKKLEQNLPEENEYVPLDCILPIDYHNRDCVPKFSGGIVFDYPIVYRETNVPLGNWFEEPDYYGLLRVEYAHESETQINLKHAEAIGKSIAQSLALSIKLEYMHFEHGSMLSAEAEEEVISDESKISNAIISGIWTTASNSIKTMRTMLKMLERRNIQETDEIGRETYDNIHVQLENLGVSISPLMPSVYRSVKSVMDDLEAETATNSSSSGEDSSTDGDKVGGEDDDDEAEEDKFFSRMKKRQEMAALESLTLSRTALTEESSIEYKD